MEVYLNELTGLGQAFVSLLMSKRSWTREKELHLLKLAKACTDERGCIRAGVPEEFKEWMDKIIRWGVYGFQDPQYDICIQGHTTLLRFIDLSFTVEGLHRAGQDDLDSHAKRMDNRIVRSSTRLATFSNGEKSDWYRDKILYPFEVDDIRKSEGNEPLPDSIVCKKDNKFITYVKTDFGYVRNDLLNDKDVKRGLYPEAIPSNFTFKIQYPEFCHMYQHRNEISGANPEVKICIEKAAYSLSEFNPWLYDNLNKVHMQPIRIKNGELI